MSPADRCRHIREKLKEDGVYNGWLVSPEPYLIGLDEFRFLELLGSKLYSFYKASNKIYYESIKGRQPAWIARYLNQGKPQFLIEYAAMNRMKGLLPGVIRPDIILTENGMVATELDSVPGGLGITGSLYRVYNSLSPSMTRQEILKPVPDDKTDDRETALSCERDGMLKGFLNMARGVANAHDPLIAIVVSDESMDYRPEMEWFARAIRESGGRAYTIKPQDVIFQEDGLYFDGPEEHGIPMRIDVVYRFFELFDLKNIPKAELIMYSAKKKEVAVTPPFKPFLEEKMLYALFHHPLLEQYWFNELGEDAVNTLNTLFPRTWILDSAEMPPYGIIPGLTCGRKKAVSDWKDLSDSTQHERHFVIKPSGFSELAWGSRGVTVGEDVSRDDWDAVISGALNAFHRTPYILQEFHKGRHVQINYLDEMSVNKMNGRVRLCPYYFVEGEEVKLRGIMATICPLDKKLIHGMKDAVITAAGIKSEVSYQ